MFGQAVANSPETCPTKLFQHLHLQVRLTVTRNAPCIGGGMGSQIIRESPIKRLSDHTRNMYLGGLNMRESDRTRMISLDCLENYLLVNFYFTKQYLGS